MRINAGSSRDNSLMWALLKRPLLYLRRVLQETEESLFFGGEQHLHAKDIRSDIAGYMSEQNSCHHTI